MEDAPAEKQARGPTVLNMAPKFSEHAPRIQWEVESTREGTFTFKPIYYKERSEEEVLQDIKEVLTVEPLGKDMSQQHICDVFWTGPEIILSHICTAFGKECEFLHFNDKDTTLDDLIFEIKNKDVQVIIMGFPSNFFKGEKDAHIALAARGREDENHWFTVGLRTSVHRSILDLFYLNSFKTTPLQHRENYEGLEDPKFQKRPCGLMAIYGLLEWLETGEMRKKMDPVQVYGREVLEYFLALGGGLKITVLGVDETKGDDILGALQEWIYKNNPGKLSDMVTAEATLQYTTCDGNDFVYSYNIHDVAESFSARGCLLQRAFCDLF